MAYYIGIDTGGTFTDVTVLSDAGEVFINKAPTTPHEFSEGVMAAVERVARDNLQTTPEALLAETAMFKHGTTVGTNALITRTGSKVGLITTRGFEDTTLIMRAVGRVSGLSEEELKHQQTAVKPTPLVPRERIFGVAERLTFTGEVLIPLDEEGVRAALRALVEVHHVDAIAVNLIFGFVNPAHEQRIREIAHELYGPDRVAITLASELVPVVREYARSNTVIVNAFLDRTMRRYMTSLDGQLRARAFKNPLLIMQANGGAVQLEEMTPIGTVNSGPSGGMIATKYIADLLGHQNVISTDMGGTSFDVGVIQDGFWRYLRDPVMARFNVTWPVIDIQSIGAGGGTIAWVDPVARRLRVGPMSAAASPGPVCYETGGTEPTVTDANVALGIINPDNFLGGRMRLNRGKAEAAIRERIADPLGLDLLEAAVGIHEIINGHMSDLIARQVVTTGRLPREHVIYTFGGAGPVHAAGYGTELAIPSIYVLPMSAVFSAFGVASADVVHTRTISSRHLMPAEPDVLNRLIGSVEDQLADVMQREGIDRERVEFRRTFYMRYRKQLNEIEVVVPTKAYEPDDVQDIMAQFERQYERIYGRGSAYGIAGMELISIRVDAISPTVKPVIRSYPERNGTSPKDALVGLREVFWPKVRAWQSTRIYDYARLEPGNVVDGPAIVETPITTVVIPSSMAGRVDRFLNLELREKN